MAEPVSLTIVSNEIEAEMICQLLRADDIPCTHRITNYGFGMGGEMPLSGGGPRQVLVPEPFFERARELLASFEEAPDTTDTDIEDAADAAD